MELNIYGLGYVGTALTTFLASKGHQVFTHEINHEKVESLRSGELHIFEQGLAEVFYKSKSNINFNSFPSMDEKNGPLVHIICVGTPTTSAGDVDLSHLKNVLGQIKELVDSNLSCLHNIIVRSTVPPGTMENIVLPLFGGSSSKNAEICFYPEFLREGNALTDLENPSINIFSGPDSFKEKLKTIFNLNEHPENVSFKTAEMIKYLNNSFHALKVAFSNECASIANLLDVDIDELFDVFLSDKKLNISERYLKPGFSYGGICLNKDVRALKKLAREKGVESPLITSIDVSNKSHTNRVFDILENSLENTLIFAGVTFKPGTDDTRGSEILKLIERLSRKPSYVQQKRIIIVDHPKVTDKLKKCKQYTADFSNQFPADISRDTLVVLGPYLLNEENFQVILRSNCRIVDLKWHLTPKMVTILPKYQKII